MIDVYFDKVVEKLKRMGNKDNELTLRLSVIIIFTGIFLSISAIVIEIALRQSFWMMIPSIMIFFMSVLFPFVFDQFERPIKGMVLFVAYIYLPSLFFTNGGIDGIITLLFLMILIYEAFYFKGKPLIVVLSTSIIYYSLLMTFSYYHNEYVIHYLNSFHKSVANVFVFVCVSTMVSIIAVTTFKGYRDEHNKLTSLQKELEENNKILRELSIRDQLTGVYNRRWFSEVLASELDYYKKGAANFYILMLDIDNFKQINDTHGHLYGDEVLRKVAHEVVSTTRDYDVVARYGGEEFVAIIPNLENKDAISLSERIRQNIQQIKFRDNVEITISIGVTKNKENDTIQSLLERADKMLYQAKDNGKNCVKYDF